MKSMEWDWLQGGGTRGDGSCRGRGRDRRELGEGQVTEQGTGVLQVSGLGTLTEATVRAGRLWAQGSE